MVTNYFSINKKVSKNLQTEPEYFRAYLEWDLRNSEFNVVEVRYVFLMETNGYKHFMVVVYDLDCCATNFVFGNLIPHGQ